MFYSSYQYQNYKMTADIRTVDRHTIEGYSVKIVVETELKVVIRVFEQAPIFQDLSNCALNNNMYSFSGDTSRFAVELFQTSGKLSTFVLVLLDFKPSENWVPTGKPIPNIVEQWQFSAQK